MVERPDQKKEPPGGFPDPLGIVRQPRERPTGRFPGSEHLRGRNPREVMRKIHRGDPLGLAERCERALGESAVLIDGARLFARSAARVAFEARWYEGEPALDAWLDGLIASSMRELLHEERELALDALPPTDYEWDDLHLRLAAALSVEPGVARSMCRIFNELDAKLRQPFHAIVVRGESIAEHAARTGVPESDVSDVLREVFTILATLGADDEGGAP